MHFMNVLYCVRNSWNRDSLHCAILYVCVIKENGNNSNSELKPIIYVKHITL